ncbi:MAG TPA: restriction endonuclease subunit S [Saprospiraceae bacterium]|nr:restriction endonuclease subunit S [Saprospiraceae bacterium]
MMTDTKHTTAFDHAEIPEGWVVKRFDDVADIDKESLNSNTPKDYKFDYISLSDVDSDDFKIETTRQVFATAPSRARRIVKQGDILMSTVRPNLQGFSLIRDEVKDLIASTGFAVITAKKCSNEYLFQYLFSSGIEKQFYKLLVGSNYPAINSSDVRKLKILLPPLPEQRAIARLLSIWDTAIHTAEQLIAQKELRKKWLMQQLLTGKKRLPAFAGENGVEGEWEEMHLGEMFSERNETKYFDLPLLSIGQNGVYPQDESVKKDTSNEDKSKYKRICRGDIGYNTMRMWQGRSALSNLEGIVSPAYTVVTPKKNADSLFFSYLFKTPKMTNLFWRNSQGLVDDTLNCKFKDFSIVKVVLPPTKEEQTAIARILQVADKEIGLLKAKAEQLREQKKGLMQVLLTGRVRLKIDMGDKKINL